MGLLDALNTRDGIFALGLLDAATPKPVRTIIGGGLLAALQNAQAWQQQQEDRAQRAALQGLQMGHLRAQIGETQVQAEQRKAAMAEALRKAQAAEALQQRQQQFLAAGGMVGPMAGAGGPSIMAGSGQRTPEQNAQVAGQAQARGFDFATAAALFGPEHAAKLMQGMNDARNFGRDKVAGTVDTVMPGTNLPGTMLRDEYGRPVGSVLPKAVEMRLQDLGGSVQAVNPFALQAGQGLAKTNSPDALLNSGTQWGIARMVDQRQRDANNIASAGNVIRSETDLRKEFADLPEVKNYKSALPAFVAISDAATRNNPQADINLIYGLAKLYDPTSVVREGEYATIANSQAVPEWLKGQAQRLVGGGRLTADTKAQILREAQGRIGAFQSEYQGAQQTYQSIVQQRGGSPGNVFTPIGASRRNLAPAAQGGMPSLDAIEAELQRRARGGQ